MNKDQIKGAIKETAGKVQKNVGKVIDSKDQQLKGIAKEVEGNAQKSMGNIKEVLKKK